MTNQQKPSIGDRQQPRRSTTTVAAESKKQALHSDSLPACAQNSAYTHKLSG
jgi:hypothetical protein